MFWLGIIFYWDWRNDALNKKKLGALHSFPGRRQCDRGYFIAEISAAGNGQLGGRAMKGSVVGPFTWAAVCSHTSSGCRRGAKRKTG